MRFRLGLVVGLGAGYYLGTMAGRERYEQINRMVRKVKRSEAYDVAADKAKAVVDLGVERAKDLVDSKLGKDDNGHVGGDGSLTTPLNDPYLTAPPT